MAAKHATTEAMALIRRYCSGVVCVSMSQARADALKLPPMVVRNEDAKCTNFTVSCDHITSTTGVSAAERALTARMLASGDARAGEFTRPGHIFPLVAKEGKEISHHTTIALD